ncbi:SDR family NAD(P)-dependent oxidoreductase [bacterium]|nr:SDR family NAD(P)-dependent oxidoreductase [bacterium]
MRFQSKNVLITGASRGIGLSIAKAFAAEGAHVFMTARSEERLKAEAAAINNTGGSACWYIMDVASDKSVKQTTQAVLTDFGQIHILINNAAIAHQELFLKNDASIARMEMEVNYFGLLRVARAILPSMIEKNEGTLVVVSSVTGRVPYPTQSTYSASKAAIIAFSEALRGEVKPFGIKVIVILPGVTDTEMAKDIIIDGPPPQKPEKVARIVVDAVASGKKEVITNFPSRMFIILKKLVPNITDRIMISSSKRFIGNQK